MSNLLNNFHWNPWITFWDMLLTRRINTRPPRHLCVLARRESPLKETEHKLPLWFITLFFTWRQKACIERGDLARLGSEHHLKCFSWSAAQFQMLRSSSTSDRDTETGRQLPVMAFYYRSADTHSYLIVRWAVQSDWLLIVRQPGLKLWYILVGQTVGSAPDFCGTCITWSSLIALLSIKTWIHNHPWRSYGKIIVVVIHLSFGLDCVCACTKWGVQCRIWACRPVSGQS